MTPTHSLPLPPPPDHPLSVVLVELIAAADRFGDLDDAMPSDYVETHPLTRFVRVLHEHDPVALSWLSFFVARRAVPCWEFSLNDQQLRERVDMIRCYLLDQAAVDLKWLSKAIPSPFRDCRYSDTQSASDAVAECARYLATSDPLHAAYGIGAADCAYDHVLTDDQFRRWLIERAIPVALEKRDMTSEEAEAFRAGRKAQ